MTAVKLDEGLVKENVSKLLDSALDAGEGLLRLTPTWVPRSFLHPGRRIKLFPGDLYAFGADRGGIDERWFSSTTEAANEGRVWHEGLSFCLFEGKKFLLRDAVSEAGKRLIVKRCIPSTTVGPSTRNSSITWADSASHAPIPSGCGKSGSRR